LELGAHFKLESGGQYHWNLQTRHVIKPGLTGWAQVNYAYGDSIKDSLIKLQYDLYYIKHRSVFLDINITIKTISTILFYRGQ
ncbi:sugar transferase, partial [Flavobacterium macacae]